MTPIQLQLGVAVVNFFEEFVFRSDAFGDLPDAFQGALAPKIKDRAFRALLYSPEFRAGRFRAPSSVLAITDDRWYVARQVDGDHVSIATATFEETFFIELTLILLFGALKLEYLQAGRSVSIELQFNTVRERSYSAAVNRMLTAMEHQNFSSTDLLQKNLAVVRNWPIKFRNVAATCIPPGRKLLTGTRWETVHGRFRHELTPAAALLVTEAELIFIREEKSTRWWGFRKEESKYGEIIIYLPLRRFADYEIIQERRVATLSLNLHVTDGRKQVDLTIPSADQDRVRQLLAPVSQEIRRAAGLVYSNEE